MAAQPSTLLRRLPAFRRTPQMLPLMLDRRRIYIVPSRAGFGWAVLVAVMFFGALNYLNNAALLLTCLLASSMALTMLSSFRNLHRLQVQAIYAHRPVAGATSALQLQLASGGRSRHHLQIEIGAHSSEWLHFAAGSAADPVAIEQQFLQRGLQTLPDLVIRSRWPWGLFTTWTRIRLNQQFLVWPAAEVASKVPPPFRHQGPTQAPGLGPDSDSWDGLRNYRPGDSLAHIAWKVTARSHELQVKTPPKQGPGGELVLAWEQMPGLDYASRIARLARWLRMADQAGLRYRLQLPGVHVDADRGDLQYARCMDALARLP